MKKLRIFLFTLLCTIIPILLVNDTFAQAVQIYSFDLHYKVQSNATTCTSGAGTWAWSGDMHYPDSHTPASNASGVQKFCDVCIYRRRSNS